MLPQAGCQGSAVHEKLLAPARSGRTVSGVAVDRCFVVLPTGGRDDASGEQRGDVYRQSLSLGLGLTVTSSNKGLRLIS